MNIHYIANMRWPTEKAHGLQIAKMCEAFADLGHDVTLVLPWRFNSVEGDPYEYYRVKRNFKMVSLPALDAIPFGYFGFWLLYISFAVSVFFYALLHRRDIFYSRDELPLFCVSLVAPQVIWESHTGRYDELVRRLLSRMRGLVVISKGLRDFYVARGVSESAIAVAHDAISPEDFEVGESKEESRKRLGIPQGARVALYIGRLDGWKGVDTLLTASELMREVLVVMIGGEQHQVAALRKKHPHVLFLGPRPYRELADNQAAADVLILPNTGKDEISVHYTSPLKLFTYLISGRPVIVSDLPSIREVVSEKEVYFFAPDDAASLTHTVRHAIANRIDAMGRCEAARALVTKHTWHARASAIAQAFLKV